MPTLTIPPEKTEDIELVKDYLFATMGESFWADEDYLAYSDRYPRLTELSEGRLVVLEMPTPAHQRVAKNVLRALDSWALQNGAEALMAPMPVRLWPGKFRVPDLMLYSADHRGRIGAEYAGPPDLVVEIQSLGTARIDSGEKMTEYARAGIAEYWRIVLGPPRLQQNVLREGRYVVHGDFGPGDTLRSVVFPDLTVSLDALFGPD